MINQAEVYCFRDKQYAHDLGPLIDAIRDAGHRVLTGHDSEELTMLLQVGLPTAVLYTLADEESHRATSFVMAAKRAMDRWLPLILVGPGPVNDSISLRLPESSGVTERALSFDEVPEVLGELADLAHHEKPPMLADDDDTDISSLDDALIDTVGSPDTEVRIETRIVAGDRAHILTTVSRGDNLLLQEDHDIPSDEVDLFGRMEAQHMLALAAYTPAMASSQTGSTTPSFRGEVSAPFFFDDALRREHADQAQKNLVRKLIIGLSVATVVAIATTVSATLLWNLPLPKPLAKVQKETKNLDSGQQSTLSSEANQSSSRLARLRSAYMWPPESRATGVESLSLNDELSSEIQFPGRFEDSISRFSVPDPDEAARFLSMLGSMTTAHDVWIVGHATSAEVGKGMPQIAKQRAVEVLRFLADHGIPKARLHAVRGEPVAPRADLEPDGSPRNRFVSIIIED